MPAERLATARTIVRAFDLIVILLVILSVVLVALALWLAGNRRRMLIYLGIGVIVAFLLARLAMGAAENVIVGGIADEDVAGAARAIVDTTLQDLRSITVIILIATVVLVIAAYLWGRPKWVVATTSYVSDTAGRAGSAAGAAASGGAAGVAGTRAGSRHGRADGPREPFRASSDTASRSSCSSWSGSPSAWRSRCSARRWSSASSWSCAPSTADPTTTRWAMPSRSARRAPPLPPGRRRHRQRQWQRHPGRAPSPAPAPLGSDARPQPSRPAPAAPVSATPVDPAKKSRGATRQGRGQDARQVQLGRPKPKPPAG